MKGLFFSNASQKILTLLYGSETVPVRQVQLLFAFTIVVLIFVSLLFNLCVEGVVASALNVIFALSFPISLWLYLKGRLYGRPNLMTGGLLWLIGLVWLPSDWVFNGGAMGPAPILYAVGLAYSISVRTPKSKAQEFAGWAIAMGPVVLLLVEQSWPGVIHPYPSHEVRIVDLMFSYMLAMIALVVLIKGILRKFRNELKRADVLGSKLRESALREPLTGLLNHAAILDILENRLSRQDTGSLYLLDIDRLKRFNDQLGYKATNAILVTLATLLDQETNRVGAEVGRLGSGEFLVVLPENQKSALNFDRRIRHLFSSSDLLPIPITFSGGIAQWEPDQKLAVALNRVDDAVCAAKSQGGNNTVVCTSKRGATL